MEFSGKTAFVTGAANGIGLGICRALARAGHERRLAGKFHSLLLLIVLRGLAERVEPLDHQLVAALDRGAGFGMGEDE